MNENIRTVNEGSEVIHDTTVNKCDVDSNDDDNF